MDTIRMVTMPDEYPYVQISSLMYFIVGILGLLFYGFILTSFHCVPSIKTQHFAANIIIWHVFCVFMLMLSFVLYHIMEVTIFRSMEEMRHYCQYFGPWNQFFLLGSIMWYLMLAVDLLVALLNPWIEYSSKSWAYHVIAWGTSALSASMISQLEIAGVSSVNVCWIAVTKKPRNLNLARWVYLFIPILFTWVFSFLVLMLASIKFVRRQLDVTYRAKRRSLLQYYRYLLLYGGYWTTCGTIYFEDYRQQFESYHPQRHTLIAFVTAFSVYPILLSVVWIVNTDLIQFLTRENMISRSRQDRDASPRTEHFSAVLRKDLMRYTTTGIRCSLRGIPVDAVSISSYSLDQMAPSSICQTSQASSRSGLYHEKKHVAATIYNVEYRYYEKLGFTDYAPRIFQSIREDCNISHDMYERSFAGTLLERASEGKSGMLFYFTTDRKYIVKTMTKREHAFLLEILPVYHQYLIKQPKSLLCRFLGCHSMQLPVGWSTMFFVVMENVMAGASVHERYDLKGIVSATLKDNKMETITQTQMSKRESSPLLSRGALEVALARDSELIVRRVVLNVNAATRARFSRQVTSDCAFLQELGIMDYSCLLGIRRLHQPICLSSINSLPRNALVSLDRCTVYYTGFVDILQYYNISWKFQHAILSMLLDSNEITAVPPAEYALRFLRFIHCYLLHDEEPALPIQASYGTALNDLAAAQP